jgi:hypothetical protein
MKVLKFSTTVRKWHDQHDMKALPATSSYSLISFTEGTVALNSIPSLDRRDKLRGKSLGSEEALSFYGWDRH